jgi:hypothetical protein
MFLLQCWIWSSCQNSYIHLRVSGVSCIHYFINLSNLVLSIVLTSATKWGKFVVGTLPRGSWSRGIVSSNKVRKTTAQSATDTPIIAIPGIAVNSHSCRQYDCLRRYTFGRARNELRSPATRERNNQMDQRSTSTYTTIRRHESNACPRSISTCHQRVNLWCH